VELGIDESVHTRLPEPHSKSLVDAFAEKYGRKPEEVCITSGTTEAIELICRIYAGKDACLTSPTYADYGHYCYVYGLNVTDRMPADVAFICNPNNPTGLTCPREYLPDYINKFRNTLFVYDESYMPFHTDEASQTLMGERMDNLVILRSFSKIYGLPGLRLGAVVAKPDLISLLSIMKSPWGVNSYAQASGEKLLGVDTHEIAVTIARQKIEFEDKLKSIGWIEPQPSDVNFILCKLHRGASYDLFEHCLRRRVLIRDCANFAGLDDSYVRFAITADMEPLLGALKEF
jgi:threonine-phosphate decarboxylase